MQDSEARAAGRLWIKLVLSISNFLGGALHKSIQVGQKTDGLEPSVLDMQWPIGSEYRLKLRRLVSLFLLAIFWIVQIS